MRGVLLSLGLVSALFFACSSSDSEPTSGGGAAGVAGKPSAGSGGNSASGAGGESGESGTDAVGSAGDAGSAGGADVPVPSGCEESGSGEIVLKVSGLPVTVAASITVSGSHDALESESTTLSKLPSGPYAVSAKRVYDDSPLVRTAYYAQISSPTFCLADGSSQTVSVEYIPVASSNQLWALNRSAGEAPLLGFAASVLTHSGSPAATSSAELPVGSSLAFDQEGNLWAAGATASNPTLVRYASAWLAGVGVPLTDYAYNLALGCAPVVKAMALDQSGNVWLSACDKRVLRIDRPDASPGSDEEPLDIAPNLALSGISEPSEDLAFDSAGNLWLTAGGRVLRFDRARLDKGDAGAPDLLLTVTADDSTQKALAPNFLAFDLAGNLWASDVAGQAVFALGKAQLDQRGASIAVAKVLLSLGTPLSSGRPAFDDEGSLWLPLAGGKIAKLAAEQLALGSSSEEPTVPALVISSPDVSDAGGLAFFPAASGLPLPSAQP
ncbi:MAG TPA: hypothetical protein VFK05_28420 [Polyangiaceae bacterium]|nr:hypothetical protein [Polyangiaceae bacterium]